MSLLFQQPHQYNKLKFKIDNLEYAKSSKQLEWVHAYRNIIPIFYKELDYMRHRLIQDLQNSSDIKNFNLFKFMEKRSFRYVASGF